jgi:AcrR family transcriptional regulator
MADHAHKAHGRTTDRRQQILQVSAELFAERGYAATTVRNIAERTGLLSGSLYHHFDSKEAILDEILTEFVGGLVRRADEALAVATHDARAALEQLVAVNLRAIEDHRSAILLLQNDWALLRTEPRFAHLVDEGRHIDRVWLSVLEQGQAQGTFRRDMAPELVWRFLRDAVWMAARWYEPGREHSIDGIARQYADVVFRGIASPAGESSP